MNKFKINDRVEIIVGPHKGTKGVIRLMNTVTDRYYIQAGSLFTYVAEKDIEPLDPTPEQAKHCLGRALQALVAHNKEKLLLIEHSTKWAKKCKELGVKADPVVPKP